METSLNSYIKQTIQRNWEELALTDFNGVSFQYRDIARKIAKLHILFESAGIEKGDKIALCGKNCSQWAVAFLATITYGAVAVPILHEFKQDNIHHIVNHSEAKLFFCDLTIWKNLNPDEMKAIIGALRIDDYSQLLSRNDNFSQARATLNERFGHKYPERFHPSDIVYHEPERDELAVINYTSGSMGLSKGVMIPYRALMSNIEFSLKNIDYLHPGDGQICMLPMAHMYGLVIELLFPLIKGCHIFFLTRVPSPKIIIDAFAKVKPKLIITVPLVIEKIIKTKVFPLLEKPLMKLMLMVPFVDNKLLGKIKERLTETFGGNLHQLIIGGAALNKDVENFLRHIQFPYTVGYGMTECAPLICYAHWHENREKSCGKVVDGLQLNIDSPNPKETAGELSVKGDNVMLGYFKNDEATNSALTPDGWLHTGDLCTIDDDGFIYIHGRCKSMILGPSGQNIYPEEIEQKINNMPYVNESIVIDDDGKIVALVHPDIELGQQQGYDFEMLEQMMKDNIALVNKELPSYSRISEVRVHKEEFEKTPKRSIKRYLYMKK